MRRNTIFYAQLELIDTDSVIKWMVDGLDIKMIWLRTGSRYSFPCSLKLIDKYRVTKWLVDYHNGYIIICILHHIFMFSNKMKLEAG